MLFQVSRQRSERGERGRARAVQVIQAHQDRSRCGSSLEVRSHLGDRPRRRVQRITSGIIGGDPGEWLTQGRAQFEERDRLAQLVRRGRGQGEPLLRGDRKSTRLNSSHVRISYAVFCLKKKKKTIASDINKKKKKKINK